MCFGLREPRLPLPDRARDRPPCVAVVGGALIVNLHNALLVDHADQALHAERVAQRFCYRRRRDSNVLGAAIHYRHSPHLILFDAGTYGIAEMPAAACVPKKARARKAIINVRKKFEAACGKATSSWKQLGAVVTISGVGLWDKPHTQNPHAPNFAELHPVTRTKFISGCGA